ncbi:MAG: SOS response-associated peptidase family protein [Bacteroidetes bacterium]|nr:SOS response-associated peptidase family protein [Bacteroidota bacterium]
MCYYNGVKVTHGEFVRLKQLEKIVTTSINIPVFEGPLYAPNETFPVLKPVLGKEDFDLVNMEWGFLPSESKWPWLKDREQIYKWRRGYKDEKTNAWVNGYTTLNATCENIFVNDKGRESLYAEAAMERRILVLSTGFFEWRHLPQIGKKGQPLKATMKIPYYVYLPEYAEAHKPFFMAGLWNAWRDPKSADAGGTGEYAETFTIITAPANHLMRQVHNAKNRMPTILNEDLAYEWMFGKLSKERIFEIAATQFPATKMWAHPVAKDFKLAIDPTAPFDYNDDRLILNKEAA